jgi:REP-associated tyrosine transposase
MGEYRHGAHTVYEIHLHLVWITKYRRPALTGEVGPRVRDLIREIRGQHDVLIIKGHVAKDHLHLFVSIPPQVTISRLVQALKGKTAYKLLQESHICGRSSGASICGRADIFVAVAAMSPTTKLTLIAIAHALMDGATVLIPVLVPLLRA